MLLFYKVFQSDQTKKDFQAFKLLAEGTCECGITSIWRKQNTFPYKLDFKGCERILVKDPYPVEKLCIKIILWGYNCLSSIFYRKYKICCLQNKTCLGKANSTTIHGIPINHICNKFNVPLINIQVSSYTKNIWCDGNRMYIGWLLYIIFHGIDVSLIDQSGTLVCIKNYKKSNEPRCRRNWWAWIRFPAQEYSYLA